MAHTSFVLFCTFLIICSSLAANICDICDCQPDERRVFSITCDCQITQDLQLTSSMMMGVNAATMVIIKNCQTVSIERNSFAQLRKLDTLGIQNCQHIYLATGAFSTLNSLLINSVQDVVFGEMAFMGARAIKNIVINYSNITEIPKFALYDVQGMDRLNLYNVNIGKIKSNAINLNSVSIGMENIKIGHVEKDGFVAEALKIFVKESEFGNHEPSSIKLSSTFQTRLLNNNFTGDFLIDVNSPFAEFAGNTFRNLTVDAFKSITMPRLINNTILGTNFENIFENFDHKDFHHNLFSCECNKNLLNFTKHSYNYEILRKNYCIANCSLSLFDFEVEFAAMCMKDGFVNLTGFCLSRVEASSPSPVVALDDDNSPFALQPRYLHDSDDNINTYHSGSNKLELNLVICVMVLLLSLKQ